MSTPTEPSSERFTAALIKVLGMNPNDLARIVCEYEEMCAQKEKTHKYAYTIEEHRLLLDEAIARMEKEPNIATSLEVAHIGAELKRREENDIPTLKAKIRALEDSLKEYYTEIEKLDSENAELKEKLAALS